MSLLQSCLSDAIISRCQSLWLGLFMHRVPSHRQFPQTTEWKGCCKGTGITWGRRGLTRPTKRPLGYIAILALVKSKAQAFAETTTPRFLLLPLLLPVLLAPAAFGSPGCSLFRGRSCDGRKGAWPRAPPPPPIAALRQEESFAPRARRWWRPPRSWQRRRTAERNRGINVTISGRKVSRQGNNGQTVSEHWRWKSTNALLQRRLQTGYQHIGASVNRYHAMVVCAITVAGSVTMVASAIIVIFQ